MRIVTVDFETYYGDDYTLSKMSTEAYVRDPRFKAFGAAIKVDDEDAEWVDAADLRMRFDELNLGECAILCQHAQFDGLILAHHYRVNPAYWLDTLSMARFALGCRLKSHGLKSLADHYKLPPKGGFLENMKGVINPTPEQLRNLGEYSEHDADLTYTIYTHLKLGYLEPLDELKHTYPFPDDELELIDQTIRMFTEPVLELDVYQLGEELVRIRNARDRALWDSGVAKEDLMSNPKFAAALAKFGGYINVAWPPLNGGKLPSFTKEAAMQASETPFEIPMKVSQTTGKTTYAFSKTDKGMAALLDHPDIRVQALVGARLKVKSTILESRTEAFIGSGQRGPTPVYLKYCGADTTSRDSGGDKANFQNLSRGSILRDALLAPPGYSLVVGDSAGIELRVNAALAMQEDALEMIRKGEDLYCHAASAYYGRPITKADKDERQFGKVMSLACFAEDTLVLTHSGPKRIIDITTSDTVWDGQSWVTHKGVVLQGIRDTVRFQSVSATPDHEVLTADGWRGWYEVHTNRSLLTSAQCLATLPSSGGSHEGRSSVRLTDGTLGCGALAGLSTLWTDIIWPQVALQDATPARRSHHPQKCIGNTKRLWTTINTAVGYLTGWLQQYRVAIVRALSSTVGMVGGGLQFALSGGRMSPCFWNIFRPSRGGITRPLKWTAQITVKGMSRAIYGFQPGTRTCTTDEQLCSYKQTSMPHWQRLPVYDLLEAGPNSRFTILTDAGPLIVHNCGYGMGVAKFQETARTRAKIVITQEEARHAVNVYRGINHRIAAQWSRFGDALPYIAGGAKRQIDPCGILEVVEEGILTPGGFVIKYPGLCQSAGEWTYRTKKDRTRLYGAKCQENVVQRLARQVVFEQALELGRRWRVVLRVHDEIVLCVPDEQVEDAVKDMERVMSQTPKWMPHVPIACEVGYAKSYGDAK